jgi:histidine kinase/DNA gyrase B/HSP90-like ATPase
MSAHLTLISPSQIQKARVDWVPVGERPIIGKDVLELLSSSMYVNVLSIYREYVQNAADAIDAARQTGVLGKEPAGRVEITVDQQERTVRIRDNGSGLSQDQFVERLVAFGASKKRGSGARGFRGVGRLAGIGYCQELIFRSKAADDAQISELRWDCRKLKTLLRSQEYADNLERLVSDIVTTRTLKPAGSPRHFFEVELAGIIRHGNDVLMDTLAIENYLSQVAPVPFAPEFSYREAIEDFLKTQIKVGCIEIHINGGERPIYRPHRTQFEVRKRVVDRFDELQQVIIPGSEGAVAAVGWILHHGYLGAFPNNSMIKGLRLRAGNMQIGEADLLDDIFTESRFNSWVVGEVHILDERILPNGRRDQFEQSVHFRHVLSRLAPLARDLGRRCRASSIKRNWTRQFEQGVAFIKDRQAILRQAAVTRNRRTRLKDEILDRAALLEKIAALPALDAKTRSACHKRLVHLSAKLPQLFYSTSQHQNLKRFRGARRRLVQKLVDIVYDATDNQAVAKALVEKILRRL